MNKFLWRLFGIDEDEVPDVSRRGFLKMLSGAAVVGAVAPKYFLAPEGGWNTGWIITPVTYEDISAATMDHIVPHLVDNVFKCSPLLMQLSKSNILFNGKPIFNPIQFERLG